jgi:hypothetical protein
MEVKFDQRYLGDSKLRTNAGYKCLKVHESPHVPKICPFWVHYTPQEGQVI